MGELGERLRAARDEKGLTLQEVAEATRMPLNYLEALENYHTAIEVTALRKTRTDAMLAKATLLSSFLDADEEALKVYQEVGRNFPEGAEIATYREGLLLFELNRFEEAAEVFKSYNTRYRAGRFQFQAEGILFPAAKTHLVAIDFFQVKFGDVHDEVTSA